MLLFVNIRQMLTRVCLLPLSTSRNALPYTFIRKLILYRSSSSSKTLGSSSIERIQQPSSFPVKQELQLPDDHDPSTPSRSMDELLSVDVRTLPSILRWHCLEAVLTVGRRVNSLNNKEDQQVNGHRPVGSVNWPQSYLYTEHRSRWRNWTLGIHVLPQGEALADLPDWFTSDRFKLLLLSTAVSAPHLSPVVLLQLVGCFSSLWPHFDSKVSASLLRLLTTQVNEVSDFDLVRLTGLLREFPSVRYSGATSDRILDSAALSHRELAEESDLLRDACLEHIRSKVSRLESLGAVLLFEMLTALDGLATADDQERVLMSIEGSLITTPQQQSLYTLVFSCACMNKLGIFRRGLVNRCFGQIQRKIRLSHRFPTVDQTWWISAAITALANLHTVHHSQSVTNLGDFVRPALGQAAARSLRPAVDISSVLSTSWCRQVLTDITGYVASQLTGQTDHNQHREVGTRSLLPQAQIAYALALLGYRATSLLQLLKPYRDPEGTQQSGDSSASDAGRVHRMLTLPDLLVGSGTDSVNLESVSWLPRVDWQFYYRLAAELEHQGTCCGSETDWQLGDYVAGKTDVVQLLCQALRSRLTSHNKLQILPFHRYQVGGDATSRFADILFVKESQVVDGVTKLVACVVCHTRDSLASLPLQRLCSAHNSSPLTAVQLITVDCTELPRSPGQQRLEFCDQVLHRVAQGLVDSGGVASSQLNVWSEVDVQESEG